MQAVAHQLEASAVALVAALRSGDGGGSATPAQMKKQLDAHVERLVAAYWALADDLIVKFADGGLTLAHPDGTVTATNLGYPSSWLGSDAVNFKSGPTRLPGPAGDELPAAVPYGTTPTALVATKPATQPAPRVGLGIVTLALAVGLVAGGLLATRLVAGHGDAGFAGRATTEEWVCRSQPAPAAEAAGGDIGSSVYVAL